MYFNVLCSYLFFGAFCLNFGFVCLWSSRQIITSKQSMRSDLGSVVSLSRFTVEAEFMMFRSTPAAVTQDMAVDQVLR